MSDEAPKRSQPCERCGAAATFTAFISRSGDQPAYRIFKCVTCDALTWIAEKIAE